MSYATYTTEAIVCGSWERGNADRSFLLFTREAGMLFAAARSVREERSRQRFALQEFSLVRVSLVQGKQGWRIGSVEALSNPFSETLSREARGSVVKIVRLLRRYIHGEEPHERTYQLAVETLRQVQTGTIAHRDSFEVLFELNLLFVLGYVATDPQLEPLLSEAVTDFDRSLTPAQRQLAAARIEQAAAASHL